MRNRKELFLFSHMAYFMEMFYSVMDFLPPSIRKSIFRIILKEFGTTSYIDYHCHIRYPHRVSIGNYVEINRALLILPSFQLRDAVIEIGDNVTIGPNVTLIGAGQNPDSITSDIGGSILIGNNVYIGANSTIRYGVSIGSNSVIAAGAMVVNNIDAFTLVGGVPSRFIRRIGKPGV